jgi:hypothetical protein
MRFLWMTLLKTIHHWRMNENVELKIVPSTERFGFE